MNYRKIYNQIIENRLINKPLTTYTETHHIVPLSLGGADHKSNVVVLTAREHFICHALLAEMYPKFSFEWYKTNHAFMMMKSSSDFQKRYYNSRIYEKKRKDFSEVMKFNQSGEKNSQFGKIWIHSKSLKKSLKIDKWELDYYIESGFELGRIVIFDKILKPKISRKKDKVKTENLKCAERPIIIFDGLMVNNQRIIKLQNVFSIEIKNIDDLIVIKNLLIDLYIHKNLSLPEIANVYNTNHVFILNYMKFFKIQRRTLSESQINLNFKK